MKNYLFSLLALSPALFCDNTSCPAPACPEMCCPEINDCCKCNACPPTYVITPNAGPCIECGSNFYLTADFIYWQAREDNLAISVLTGYTQANDALTIPPFPDAPAKGKAAYPD